MYCTGVWYSTGDVLTYAAGTSRLHGGELESNCMCPSSIRCSIVYNFMLYDLQVED